jgi:hypothetical protein
MAKALDNCTWSRPYFLLNPMADLATIQYQKTCMDTLLQLQFCHTVQIFTDFSYRKKIKNCKFQPKIPPPLLSLVFNFFLISQKWQIIAGKINYTGKNSFSPSQVFLKNKSHKIVNHHTKNKIHRAPFWTSVVKLSTNRVPLRGYIWPGQC